MKPDGTYIAAVLEFWYRDSSKKTRYCTKVTFRAVEQPGNQTVALWKQIDILIGPPMPIDNWNDDESFHSDLMTLARPNSRAATDRS